MAIFCSSLTSWFPGISLTYFLNDFETVPVAPFLTGITFVFTFHMRWIYILRSLYFRIFSAYFLITFMSREIATSINIHVPFSLSRIMMPGLLLEMVLLACTCWFHNMVTLPPWLVSIAFETCSYQCFTYYYYYYYYYYYCCCCKTLSRRVWTFLTTWTTAQSRILSSARWIQPTPQHTISLRFVLLYLRLHAQNGNSHLPPQCCTFHSSIIVGVFRALLSSILMLQNRGSMQFSSGTPLLANL